MNEGFGSAGRGRGRGREKLLELLKSQEAEEQKRKSSQSKEENQVTDTTQTQRSSDGGFNSGPVSHEKSGSGSSSDKGFGRGSSRHSRISLLKNLLAKDDVDKKEDSGISANKGDHHSSLEAKKTPEIPVEHLNTSNGNANQISSRYERSTEKEALDLDSYAGIKRGVHGKQVPLECNYIRLKTDPNRGIFCYEVRFRPAVDSMRTRLQILNKTRELYGGVKMFDGDSILLPIKLPQERLDIDDNEFNVTMSFIFKEKKSCKDSCHLYNILFDRVMKTLKYIRFKRMQFDPTNPKIIPQAKLEIWPGYVTAVDEYDGGLMLCCDVSHRVLCQKTVLEELQDIYQSNKENFKDNAYKSLLGSVIITRYNNKSYRIDDIDFEGNPLTTFKVGESQELSFADYYKNRYNLNIRDLKQPLLISRKKAVSMKPGSKPEDSSSEMTIILIPELAHLTGLRDHHRQDYRLMQEIASFTRVSPAQRINALGSFYRNVQQCAEAKKILNDWGLQLSDRPEKLTGRNFEPETIYFKNRSIQAGVNADFTSLLNNNQVFEAKSLNNWIVIHYHQTERECKTFLNLLQQSDRLLGMSISNPKIVKVNDLRLDSLVNVLRNCLHSKLEMVVFIVPNQREDRYNAIKKICVAEYGIPSQVIIGRTLSKEQRNKAIVLKIALQINCKLGGAPWAVKIPFKNVMICGIDAYHDPTNRGNSVSAFVASLNSTYTRWYSKANMQGKREEISNGLAAAFVGSLQEYHKANTVLPDSIIVYRDGVSDSQMSLCLHHEIPQFERDIARIFPNYKPKITFVVVQKRINTRFFLSDSKGVVNPQPGTVVDSEITRKNAFDFFLVSQSVRQGTVSPSHYVCIRDDSKFGPDVIQRLSYKLTYMYFNWSGTIRIPACCQYAHRLAYLVGQNIRRSPHAKLNDTLFYL